MGLRGRERSRGQTIYITVTCGIRVSSFFFSEKLRVMQIAVG